MNIHLEMRTFFNPLAILVSDILFLLKNVDEQLVLLSPHFPNHVFLSL